MWLLADLSNVLPRYPFINSPSFFADREAINLPYLFFTVAELRLA
jgi:hypothetical protein